MMNPLAKITPDLRNIPPDTPIEDRMSYIAFRDRHPRVEADFIAELRALHTPCKWIGDAWFPTYDGCAYCADEWPCSTTRVLDLHERVTASRKGRN